MKKITLLFTLLAIMVSANLKGQSTYLLPFRGATQTYTATVTDPGNNNPVRWFVATNATGTTRAVHGTDYTFVTAGYNSGNNQLQGTGIYSVDIRWGAGVAVGTNYFVFLEVDDDVTACTNRMALQVAITASFNAILADVSGVANPGSVDATTVPLSSCPGVVINPLWNGTGQTDIGYSELVFRVNREFSQLAWQFEYRVTEATSKPIAVQNVRVVNASGTQVYTGTNATGIINLASTQDYALVYVRVTNQQGVVLGINMDLITAGNNTKDAGNNADSKSADNSADHTIDPMPAITGFGGN